MGALIVKPTAAPKSSTDVQVAPPQVGFNLKDIPPTQNLYVQKNDVITFWFISNLAALGCQIKYRILQPDGNITEGTLNVTAGTSVGSLSLGAFEGWIISLAAITIGGFTIGQWFYLQATLNRSPVPGFSGQLYATIWEGYVPNNVSEGWPGTPAQRIGDGAGRLRIIVGTTPAAGAEIVETVPGSRRWNLLGWSAVLTTSAAVANRIPTFFLDDGSTQFASTQGSTNQAASLVIRYNFCQNVPSQALLAGSVLQSIDLPFPLRTGCRIQSATTNLQAADQWTGPRYWVQEWGDWDT